MIRNAVILVAVLALSWAVFYASKSGATDSASKSISVLVALRDIEARSKISDDVVEKRSLAVNDVPATVHPLSPERLVDWRTAKNRIRKGQIISIDDIDLPTITRIEACKEIVKGEIIKREDVREVPFIDAGDGTRVEKPLTSLKMVIGKKAKFRIESGTLVNRFMIEK